MVALRHIKRRKLNLMTTANLRLHLHVLAAVPAVFTHFRIHVNCFVAADKHGTALPGCNRVGDAAYLKEIGYAVTRRICDIPLALD